MAGSRYAYTLEEDNKILRYIIDGHYEAIVKGNAIWIKMEEENLCPGRSWQSLKNRFKRHILPDISRPEFRLTREEKALMKARVSSSTSDTSKPLVKRNTDPRLIRDRLEKYNSSDSVHQERNNHAMPDSTSGEDTLDGSGSTSSANHAPARKGLSLTPPDKEFFSLDMEWSDSD